MTKLFLHFLSRVAPGTRFPGTWARLNRIGPWRRSAISTLLGGLSKPSRAAFLVRVSEHIDHLADADAAVNAAMQARMRAAGASTQEALRAARVRAEAALEVVDGFLRRYWPRPGEAPAVAAAASATLATLIMGLVSQFPGSVPEVSPTSGRVAIAGATEAVEPQAGEATPARPEPEPHTQATPPPDPATTTAAEPAPAETAAPSADVWAPPVRGALPIGKGMWLYMPERVEGGDPHAIVAKANAIGLTHVYVRTGSSKMGFYAQDFLNELLPVAHENGLRVYGWDFPYFYSWSDDVYRALEAITYTTPDGHRIDGFSADIETEAEGTQISAHHAHEYGTALRRLAGPDYPLIATVPRPSSGIVKGGFPYAELAPNFDAFAPMVYWMQRDSMAEVVTAMEHLSQFGRPVMPVGQAYDGGLDGGHPGVPSAEAIIRFMQGAEAHGAPSVSFWSWQHADEQAWHAIHVAAEFRLAAGTPEQLPRGMLLAYQVALAQYGFDVEPTGIWDEATTAAVAGYQEAVGLPVSAIIDEATVAAVLRPFRPPTTFR